MPSGRGYSISLDWISIVFGEGKPHEMACMAHVPRKFVDVFTSQGNAVAEEAIRRIAALYAVEKDARAQSSDARVALRQARAKPIFEKGGRNVREWFAARNQFAIMIEERFNA